MKLQRKKKDPIYNKEVQAETNKYLREWEGKYIEELYSQRRKPHDLFKEILYDGIQMGFNLGYVLGREED